MICKLLNSQSSQPEDSWKQLARLTRSLPDPSPGSSSLHCWLQTRSHVPSFLIFWTLASTLRELGLSPNPRGQSLTGLSRAWLSLSPLLSLSLGDGMGINVLLLPIQMTTILA